MQTLSSLKYLCIVAFLMATLTSAAQGQFYQYTDKNGNIVFTNTPPPGSDAKEKKTKDRGVYFSAPGHGPDQPSTRETGKAQNVQEQEKQRRPDFGGITVVMYKTNW